MAKILIRDIIGAIEHRFPPIWQETFDNTGLQLGETARPCTGVLLCVDATPEIVCEAIDLGCNLIISHHPLIFHPLKRLDGYDRVTRTIYKAIRNDIAIYSCHTSVDNAPIGGVSKLMGELLGLKDIEPLEDKGPEHIGSGIVGNLSTTMTPEQLVKKVKEVFGTPVARCSNPAVAPTMIHRMALCGGAGNYLIPDAIKAGAQAFMASDCKHNQFIDLTNVIFLIDIGHYESEKCTKDIFHDVIREKFPNFAIHNSEIEKNPIHYL